MNKTMDGDFWLYETSDCSAVKHLNGVEDDSTCSLYNGEMPDSGHRIVTTTPSVDAVVEEKGALM